MRLRMGAFGLGTILAGVTATALSAQPAAKADDTDHLDLPLEGKTTGADWIKAPDGEDLWRLYPPLAALLEVDGVASLDCVVEPVGTLSGCKVSGESPMDLGFGDATLLAAGEFRMKPATLNGKPVQGQVTIPITWKMPDTSVSTVVEDAALPPPTSPSANLALARRIVTASGAGQAAEANAETYMRHLLASEIAKGAAAPSAEQEAMVFSAVRRRYAFAASTYAELLARRYAQDMSAADLAQTAAFLESSPGRAWSAEASYQTTPTEQKALSAVYKRAIRAARNDVCIRIRCSDHTASATLAKPDPGQ